MASSPSRPVEGRYQQYKRGTHKIVEWLWKAAEDATQVKEMNVPRTSAGNIGIKGLLFLAEIVSQTVKAAVPARIVDLLQEVISAREDFATWYSSQPCSIPASNGTHRHFIAVLQKIYDILLPCREDQAVKGSDRKLHRKSKPLDVPVSAFACLAVEEPSESPLGEEPSPKPANSSPKPVEPDFDLDDDLFSIFEIWCFLVDLRDVRRSTVSTVLQYAKGEVSALVTTSVLEVGFGLSRIANENIVKSCPLLSDWWKLLAFFGLELEQVQGIGCVTYVFPKEARPEHLRCQPALDPTDLICPAAAQTLRILRGYYRQYEPGSRNSGARLRRDGVPLKGSRYCLPMVLIELMPNLCYYSSHPTHGHTSTHTAGSSEFLQAIMKYFRTNVLPVWLPIAFQTYCEVFEVIGSNPSCIADLYLDWLDECEASVSTYETCTKATHRATELESDNWSECMKWASKLGILNRFMLRASSDGIHTDRQYQPIAEGTCLISLESLPCAAGVNLWHLQHLFHATCFNVAGDMNLILSMANIYTAMRRYGLLSSPWHDMEFVIAQHKGSKSLVIKANDRDPYAYLKHFLLVLGVPASSLTPGKQLELPRAIVALEQSRKPVPTSDIVDAMRKQSREANVVGNSSKDIERLLARLVADVSAPLGPRGRENANSKNVRLTPSQYLAVFKETLIADEPHTHFDYMEFWQVCMDLFKDLLVQTFPYFRDMDVEDYGIPHGWVFHMLQGAAITRDMSRPLNVSSRLPIVAIAQPLEDFIKQCGNKISQKAFSKSSGRIPKDQRPKFTPYDIHPGYPVLTILSQDPTSSLFMNAAYASIYDPNGSKDRVAQTLQTYRQYHDVVRAMSEASGHDMEAEVLLDRNGEPLEGYSHMDPEAVTSVMHMADAPWRFPTTDAVCRHFGNYGEVGAPLRSDAVVSCGVAGDCAICRSNADD